VIANIDTASMEFCSRGGSTDILIDKMSQQDPSKPLDPRHSTPSSNKRKYGNTQAPNPNVQLPDVPWYHLDYRSIIS